MAKKADLVREATEEEIKWGREISRMTIESGTDKSEKDPANREKFEKVQAILDEEFGEGFGRGTCHRRWERKKELLKEMYDIDWKSPAELNPHVLYD